MIKLNKGQVTSTYPYIFTFNSDAIENVIIAPDGAFILRGIFIAEFNCRYDAPQRNERNFNKLLNSRLRFPTEARAIRIG